jgi:DNA primase
MLRGLFLSETANQNVLSMKTNQATASRFVDFRQVKANVTILQVLEHYNLVDTLKQTGDRLSGPCPIHHGNNPTSFRVSISKNCFNCFGECGRGGNVIDFVALNEGIEFRDAALLLQEWFMGGNPAPPSNASSRALPSSKPQGPAVYSPGPDQPQQPDEPDQTSSEATGDELDKNPPLTFELSTLKADHPHFAKRGLRPDTVEHFGLGYCSRGLLRGHIAIPIHNGNGDLIAYAGRWPGEPPDGQPKYKLPKGFRKSLEIFNLHRALQEPADLPLVVVEGFFDCFSLWQAGITKCVALMGCSISPEQESLLASAMPNGGTIELLFDNDEAGRHGTEEVARRLLEFALVRSVSLPDGVRQPDELSEDEVAEVFA